MHNFRRYTGTIISKSYGNTMVILFRVNDQSQAGWFDLDGIEDDIKKNVKKTVKVYKEKSSLQRKKTISEFKHDLEKDLVNQN